LIQINVVVASEGAGTEFIVMFSQNCPYAVPSLFLSKFECNAKVVLVPMALGISALKGFVGELDGSTIGYDEVNGFVGVCGIE